MKKDGGTIKNWQMHIASDKPKDLVKAKELNPDFEMDKVMVFTGTVVDDPTGRWLPGYHMRSTLVLKHDVETGIVETQNTIYKLEGEEGGDVLNDMGAAVMNIYY